MVTRPLEMLQSLQCAVLMGNIHVGLCPDIIKWCTIPAPDETSFPSEPASDHKLKIPPVHSQRTTQIKFIYGIPKILSPWSCRQLSLMVMSEQDVVIRRETKVFFLILQWYESECEYCKLITIGHKLSKLSLLHTNIITSGSAFS